ncbi:DNA-processing protein DprA [Kaarinaea lacus]
MSQLSCIQEENPTPSYDGSSTNLSADELHYWLALFYAPGIGPVTFHQLLTHCPNPRLLFESDPRQLLGEKLSLSQKSLAYLRRPDWSRVEKDLAWAEQPGCHIISLLDPRYPSLLKEITDAPPMLFVRGNTDVLTMPQLAMVGSRNPSRGGWQMARDFAQMLATAGLTITSGLALGIDAASHEGALESGFTIAVAGTGLDRIYPARHRDLAHRIAETGAIISEFPLGTTPVASNFPRRNRIISGLSLGTLVVEAAVQSGSLITARLAGDQGREVFAMPGSIHNPLSRGCHELIRQGAKLVETLTDILDELGPLATWVLDTRPDLANEVADSEKACFDEQNPVIENMGYEPISIDTLVERCGLTPGTVSSMLLTLELQGRVTSTGGLYSRIDKSR